MSRNYYEFHIPTENFAKLCEPFISKRAKYRYPSGTWYVELFMDVIYDPETYCYVCKTDRVDFDIPEELRDLSKTIYVYQRQIIKTH